jgi:hypothetical protein
MICKVIQPKNPKGEESAMPEHTVRFTTPKLDVPKVDLFFEVKRDGRAFGRLRISKGGVEWMQKFDRKKAFRLNWEELDKKLADPKFQGGTRLTKKH